MKTLLTKILYAVTERFKTALFWVALPLLALGALWCSGALFHAFDAIPIVGGVAVFALWALLLLSLCVRRAMAAAALMETAVAAAFLCITPQQRFRDTVWQKPWRRTLAAEKLADGRYRLKNVRDFRYRSEYEFDVRYRTAVVSPERIASIDAVFSHWDDMEEIAHSMLGLNFADGTTIVISLETRLPEGVEQNGIDGLYKRYALAMLAGTPEDLYGLRTDHRGETLYAYRLKLDRDAMRKMTLSLLERSGELQRRPEFYNSLARNCTTGLLPMLPDSGKLIAGDLRLLLNGMAAKMLFDLKLLVCRENESFGSLRARSLVPGRCRGKDAPAAEYGGESETRWLRDRRKSSTFYGRGSRSGGR